MVQFPKEVKIISVILLAQALGLVAIARDEREIEIRELSDVPVVFDSWQRYREGVVEKEIQDVLQADDTLTRTYTRSAEEGTVNFFVAYFETQRTGKAPHSPKNCLPGSGWVPTVSDTLSLTLPDRAEPVEVNRKKKKKGEYKYVVLYWYQSRDRVVASEYAAKVYLVLDSLRYNRSDTALVRVMAPVTHAGEEAASRAAADFARSAFAVLAEFPQFQPAR